VQNNFTYKDICKPTRPWRRVFTNKLSAIQAGKLCQKLNATHTVINNKEDDIEYRDFITKTLENNKDVVETCSHANVGNQYGPTFILAQHKAEGEVETNPVQNPYTGVNISYANWYNGWPNSNYIDKDSYWIAFNYNGGDSKFLHFTNSDPLCFTCAGLSNNLPVVRMRGLCKGSQFDRNYVLAQNNEDVLFYQGDRHTNITYNREESLWRIISNRKVEGGPEQDPPVKGYSMVRFQINYKIILSSHFHQIC
jgi:hypothetical protein